MKGLVVVLLTALNLYLILSPFPNIFKSILKRVHIEPRVDMFHQGSIEGHLVTEWGDELMGKKLSDVRSDTTFTVADLPIGYRIITPGGAYTREWKPERLNVHLNRKSKVIEVARG